MTATVYCRNGRKIVFTWIECHGQFRHVTTRGTVYALVHGPQPFKTFWIARINGDSAFTWEAVLRAERIEFSDGGVFYFPR